MNQITPSADNKIARVLCTPLGSYTNTAHRILSLKMSKFWEMRFSPRWQFVDHAMKGSKYASAVGALAFESRIVAKKIAQEYDDHRRTVEAGARSKTVRFYMEGVWEREMPGKRGMPESKIRSAMLANAVRPSQEGVFERPDTDVVSLWDEIDAVSRWDKIKSPATPYEWTAILTDKDKECRYSYYFSLGIFEKYLPRLAFMDKLDLGQLNEYCAYVGRLRGQIDKNYLRPEGTGLPESNQTYGEVFHKTMRAVRNSSLFGEIKRFIESIGLDLAVLENMVYDEMKLKTVAPFISDAMRLWQAPFPAEENNNGQIR